MAKVYSNIQLCRKWIQQSFSTYTRLYATVGYNVGDGIRSFTVNGSLTENIGDIDENPGNTGIFGQWIFRLDREQFNFTSQSPANVSRIYTIK